MQVIEAQQVSALLEVEKLVEAVRDAFASDFGMPQRQVFHLDSSSDDAFAVLPAWDERYTGVKAFTYLPGNPAKGLDTLASKVLLFCRQTGAALAVVDGTELTYWRTAAVSALAADYLARKDAEVLCVCGTGRLAPYMALAHAAVRPIREIRVWGRDQTKVAAMIEQLASQRPDLNYSVVDDLAKDIAEADIVSCATGAPEPLVLGQWVQPGTHVDLVGNHGRDKRECDSELVARSEVYVDSRLNVLNEAGELLIPISEGLFDESQVRAELAELCSGAVVGRSDDQQVTLFKSVGTALSDLAAASLVYRQAVGEA